jgi:hypothetical protein
VKVTDGGVAFKLALKTLSLSLKLVESLTDPAAEEKEAKHKLIIIHCGFILCYSEDFSESSSEEFGSE